MYAIIIFYLFIVAIVGIESEILFAKGKLKDMLRDDEVKEMERFISINWESNWWHVFILFTALFWLPILVIGLLMELFKS